MSLQEKQEKILQMLVALAKTEHAAIRINWEEYLRKNELPIEAMPYIIENFLIKYSGEGTGVSPVYSWKTNVDYPTRLMARAMIKDLNLDNYSLKFGYKEDVEPVVVQIQPQELHEVLEPVTIIPISKEDRRVAKYFNTLQSIHETTKNGFEGNMKDLRTKLQINNRPVYFLIDRNYVTLTKIKKVTTIRWVAAKPTMGLAYLIMENILKASENQKPKTKVIADRKYTPIQKLFKYIFNV